MHIFIFRGYVGILKVVEQTSELVPVSAHPFSSQCMLSPPVNGLYHSTSSNTYTLRKKGSKRVLQLSPQKNPFWFQVKLFCIHVEPSVERDGTQNGSTWIQKGSSWNQQRFFKGFSYGDTRRTPFRFQIAPFVLRVYTFHLLSTNAPGKLLCPEKLYKSPLLFPSISLMNWYLRNQPLVTRGQYF